MTRADRPGIVVSPHHLASEAGVDILGAGGNAVDAAVAANAVLGVVAPETCGIGGDLFALVWDGSQVTCLDASGWAGSGADPTELRQAGHATIPPFHPMTVTVPGCVAGWQALATRHGRLPLGRLLEPALGFANNGFPASEELSEAVTGREAILTGQPAGEELLVDGRPPAPGERLVRPTLAATLATIARDGPSGFYAGAPAQAIVQAVGNLLTPDDLAGYGPEWVAPLSVEVFGRTAWTIPPASQGYLTVMAAALFERLDAPADPDDPTYTHLAIEAYRAAAAARDDLLADRRWLPGAFWEQLDATDLAGNPLPQQSGTFTTSADSAATGTDVSAVFLIKNHFLFQDSSGVHEAGRFTLELNGELNTMNGVPSGSITTPPHRPALAAPKSARSSVSDNTRP